jgi:hypothetical protein
MEQIFATKGDYVVGKDGISLTILNDPIHKAAQLQSQDPEFHLDKYPTAERDGYLFITAICLSFTPNFSNPRTGTYASGQNETFSFRIKDVRCPLRIFSTDRYIPGTWTGEHWEIDHEKTAEGTFILLARDHIQGFILHQLMLINMQESSGLAERATVLELLIPLDELEVLEELKPRKRRIVLA